MLLINFHWAPFWNLIHIWNANVCAFSNVFRDFFFSIAPVPRIRGKRIMGSSAFEPVHTEWNFSAHRYQKLFRTADFIYDIQYFTLQSIWVACFSFFHLCQLEVISVVDFFFGIQQFWFHFSVFHSFFSLLIPAFASCTYCVHISWLTNSKSLVCGIRTIPYYLSYG